MAWIRGKLYICIGDGQSTIKGFPLNTSRLDAILGSILRIDPSGNNSANGKYGIPSDNPWVGDADPNTLGEIWAMGFRNPHRISWDTAGDGKMLSGDIG
jgi:glucose/arabinose dehydrogenase